MSITEINQACEAILKKHESSYMANAITPAERKRFEAQGLLGRAPAQGIVTPRAQKPASFNPRATTKEIKRKVAIYEKLKAKGLTRKQALLEAGIPSGTSHRWIKVAKGEIKQAEPIYADAQIKAHLATFRQLRKDGLSIANACKVIGVSATAIRSWSGKGEL